MAKPSDEERRYFAEREIERRKENERQAELDALKQREALAVKAALNIDDDKLAEHLVDLGFDGGRVQAFALIPLVYVAWADGDVSNAERARILEVAEQRGMTKDSPAFAFLTDLLEQKPKEAFLKTCVETIRHIFDGMPTADADSAKADLVSISVAIAEVSGGFLGLFGEKIDDSERETLSAIVSELGLTNDSSVRALFED